MQSKNAAVATATGWGRSVVQTYYGATALFLGLDLFLGLNVRLAFLDGAWPLRGAYYGFCFACLGLMLWRPAWTAIIAAFESLITLAALIVSFGSRALIGGVQSLDGAGTPITLPAVINFLLAGGIAYVAWVRGIRALQRA